MQNRALILEAHHTTHIEGTRLTLEQSERILGGKRVQGARPDDAQELLNYKKAQALKVNRRTLQRDLKLLVDKGLATQVATSPTAPTKFYQPLL
jgi:Fic family protein